MPKQARIAAVILAIAIVAASLLAVFRPSQEQPQLVLSGNIEVTDVVLSFKIPGRLLERAVGEGESIETGQVVARLDGADQELFVAQAQANVALAEAVLAELEAGSRPQQISRAGAQVEQAQAALAQLQNGTRVQDIAAARADVERAQAIAEQARLQSSLAQADYERSRQLFDFGVIPRQQFDSAQTACETAQQALDAALAVVASAQERLSLTSEGPRTEQIDQARAALHQAQASYSLIAAGPRAETLDQARAQLQIARESLNQAQQQLAYTVLSAPLTGIVLSKAAEAGEYLNPGSPVISVADLDRVWLRAYINETDLSRIKLDQAVKVTADTYPGKIYPGRVSFISSTAEFTPKTVQTSDERVKLMYLVKIELSNPHQELKPGMPADARIQVVER